MITKYEKLVAVTPAKNEEEYILKCVTSVLNQTYPITLYIIVDDYSEDRTRSIVESINDSRVQIISSGLGKAKKQHGIRPHLVQQKGIDEATKAVPDWKYLLFLDADCWIPNDYCEKMINEMQKDEKIVMIGARYLKTPTKLEETSEIHVRNANHIIKREFYDLCLAYNRNYANPHGEILLERFAWINGYKTYTLPIMIQCGRETGITVRNPIERGIYDYKLGTPLFTLLFLLRKPTKEKILKIIGWLMAKLKREQRYFNKNEIKILYNFFLKWCLKW